MNEKVTLGVIGAGGIFRKRHFPALTNMKNVEVVAIANQSMESAQEIRDEFNLGADVGDDPIAVIRRDDIDAVMIGTWPYKHHSFVMQALDEGKHVFVQARMATTLSEAKEMYARSEETDRVAQICPSPMGMNGDKVVQDLIEDGSLGELYFVRGAQIGGRRGDPTDPISWRDLERYQGVNALSVGILMERLHRWVGHARTVSAVTDTKIRARPSGTGDGSVPVELPDIVTVNCEFENGAIGSFDFSNITAHGPRSQLEIYGSQGTLVYDFDEDIIYTGAPSDDELSRVPTPDADTSEWTVEADFVEAIRNGGSPRTTFLEGVKYMEFSEAVCRSVETKGQIELPLRT